MRKQKNQKGFLSFVSVLIVVMVSFIIVAAAYQFTTDSRTSANELSSNQAYYLAKSGLNAAQHYIITNGNTCTSINGASIFTNANNTGASGVYTVTSTATSASTTLNGNINASATTVALTSTSNFASSGVVLIDNEFMNYMGISGNNLTNVTRGVAGTSSASHSSGASVNQNQCALSSIGYAPNNSSPTGQRELQTIIAGTKTFSIGGNNAEIFGAGSVSLSGNVIVANTSVTSSSPNFTGSTIVSSSSVSLSGNSITQISNGSGGTTTSSSAKGTINADIQQNNTSFNSSNLFTDFFGRSQLAVMLGSNLTYNASNINGATYQSAGNKVIWITGDLSLASSTIVGTAASPVIMVVNGNTSLAGSATIYGLIYTTGNLSMSGNSSVIGLVGTGGTTTISGNSTSSIYVNYSTSILNTLLSQSSNVNGTTKYTSPVASTQELLP